MSQQQLTALAILRAGRSYDEAAKVTGLPLSALFSLWLMKS
jgi:hypothetical protein